MMLHNTEYDFADFEPDIPFPTFSLYHSMVPFIVLLKFRFVTHIISCFFFNYIYIILINCHSVCFCNQRPVNLLLHCFPCIFVEMITDDRDCPTHRYALWEYKAVRIYPQCIRYHPQNGIPVLLPASYIPSRRIAFDD